MLMLCPICAGEFDSHSGLCATCGCVLVPSTITEDFPETIDPSDPKVEFVELCRPQTNPEAMFIKSTLEQNHVAVMIQGAHSLSLMPYLAFGGQLRVLVPKKQLEYAKAIYKAYFESDDELMYDDEE